jgi:hypothetical protein
MESGEDYNLGENPAKSASIQQINQSRDSSLQKVSLAGECPPDNLVRKLY